MAANAVRVRGWATRAWSHARLRVQGDGVTADIVVTDDRGELLADLRGLVFRRAMRESGPAVAAGLYELVGRRKLCAGRAERTAGSKRWLIAADGGRVGTDLAARLRSRGHAVTSPPATADVPATGADRGRGPASSICAPSHAAASGVGAIRSRLALDTTAAALALAQALEARARPPRACGW